MISDFDKRKVPAGLKDNRQPLQWLYSGFQFIQSKGPTALLFIGKFFHGPKGTRRTNYATKDEQRTPKWYPEFTMGIALREIGARPVFLSFLTAGWR